MYCPDGNATDPIRRVLASSDGISSWTPLKPQHSNPNPNSNSLANQLWCIDFLTPPTPLIIPHRLPGFLESLMPLKNWCSTRERWSKKQSEVFHTWHSVAFFPSLKQNFIAYRSSKVSSRPGYIFEIPQLWQSGFSRVYSNSCSSSSFEPKIIKIGLSFHKMHSNNILNFQESTTILMSVQKSLESHWMYHVCALPGIYCFLTTLGWTWLIVIYMIGHSLNFLLRCSTRQYKWGVPWDSNSSWRCASLACYYTTRGALTARK